MYVLSFPISPTCWRNFPVSICPIATVLSGNNAILFPVSTTSLVCGSGLLTTSWTLSGSLAISSIALGEMFTFSPFREYFPVIFILPFTSKSPWITIALSSIFSRVISSLSPKARLICVVYLLFSKATILIGSGVL